MRAKLTFQIGGSVSLGLWAVLMFFPIQDQGRRSLLDKLVQGTGDVWFQAYFMSIVLVGYGVFALLFASRRD